MEVLAEAVEEEPADEVELVVARLAAAAVMAVAAVKDHRPLTRPVSEARCTGLEVAFSLVPETRYVDAWDSCPMHRYMKFIRVLKGTACMRMSSLTTPDFHFNLLLKSSLGDAPWRSNCNF